MTFLTRRNQIVDVVQGDVSILARLLRERIARTLEASIARDTMIEDNRIRFTSGFVYPMRGFSVFLGFQGEVTISWQEQQLTVKYEISPQLQYKIFSLLFVLGCIVIVFGPLSQFDARQSATLQVAIIALLGALIITMCFLITSMVLFPYRFDKFMQSYVREFLTVFQRIGVSSQLPDTKIAD